MFRSQSPQGPLSSSKVDRQEVISRPWGITALIVFFLLGAVISFTAALSIVLPNSYLQSMWRLNPRAHEMLSNYGAWPGMLLAVVSAFCVAAALGLWRRSRWGYWIAVGLIAINLTGDLANVLFGAEPRAIVGIPIAALILGYLFRKRVRASFST